MIHIDAPRATALDAGIHAGVSNPTHASTCMQGGEAVFENDNYRIVADDNNTVTISNKHTGETYQAWGDPHMRIDGHDTFDFWGTTTFKLEDGTKVTIETTPFAANPEMTLSSKVTITNGDYGVKISGVDSNTAGDLKIDEARGYGQVLDVVVSDGNVLHENPAGKGFLAITTGGGIKAVDQVFIDATDLKKLGQMQDLHAEAFDKLRSLLEIAFQGAFVGAQPVPPHTAPVGENEVQWPGGTPPWVFNESGPILPHPPVAGWAAPAPQPVPPGAPVGNWHLSFPAQFVPTPILDELLPNPFGGSKTAVSFQWRAGLGEAAR